MLHPEIAGGRIRRSALTGRTAAPVIFILQAHPVGKIAAAHLVGPWARQVGIAVGADQRIAAAGADLEQAADIARVDDQADVVVTEMLVGALDMVAQERAGGRRCGSPGAILK
ncbi:MULTISPECIES: hypothetical protein [unclassified Bradyrhizobium]|uniref:hypothetical protein n=1 Tax=unclassified Bradyrhizobium TaxID=2631580 RepID=UPI0028ECD81D|nr:MULTISPECIES: hypothetical protein [unclassified Bradyrhizobium]